MNTKRRYGVLNAKRTPTKSTESLPTILEFFITCVFQICKSTKNANVETTWSESEKAGMLHVV
jgi:hypothetical protein